MPLSLTASLEVVSVRRGGIVAESPARASVLAALSHRYGHRTRLPEDLQPNRVTPKSKTKIGIGRYDSRSLQRGGLRGNSRLLGFRYIINREILFCGCLLERSAGYCVPSEYLIFYIGFDHRITDIVADEDADLAMPAEQQLGMDWRDIPGIPPDRLMVVREAIDRCISAGGIRFCDFWADLPSGHREYRLKIQRNAKHTHVVVHMTLVDERLSERRVADFRGGRRVSTSTFDSPPARRMSHPVR